MCSFADAVVQAEFQEATVSGSGHSVFVHVSSCVVSDTVQDETIQTPSNEDKLTKPLEPVVTMFSLTDSDIQGEPVASAVLANSAASIALNKRGEIMETYSSGSITTAFGCVCSYAVSDTVQDETIPTPNNGDETQDDWPCDVSSREQTDRPPTECYSVGSVIPDQDPGVSTFSFADADVQAEFKEATVSGSGHSVFSHVCSCVVSDTVQDETIQTPNNEDKIPKQKQGDVRTRVQTDRVQMEPIVSAFLLNDTDSGRADGRSSSREQRRVHRAQRER